MITFNIILSQCYVTFVLSKTSNQVCFLCICLSYHPICFQNPSDFVMGARLLIYSMFLLVFLFVLFAYNSKNSILAGFSRQTPSNPNHYYLLMINGTFWIMKPLLKICRFNDNQPVIAVINCVNVSAKTVQSLSCDYDFDFTDLSHQSVLDPSGNPLETIQMNLNPGIVSSKMVSDLILSLFQHL